MKTGVSHTVQQNAFGSLNKCTFHLSKSFWPSHFPVRVEPCPGLPLASRWFRTAYPTSWSQNHGRDRPGQMNPCSRSSIGMIWKLRSSRSNQKSGGSEQIPNGKDTATHWNDGWGRPEIQAIKTERKWKAGSITHWEDLVGQGLGTEWTHSFMLYIVGLLLSCETSHKTWLEHMVNRNIWAFSRYRNLWL